MIFLKRKKVYLLLELAVLFFIFVQYIVDVSVEEKAEEKGQAVLSDRVWEQAEEAVSDGLARQVETENVISEITSAAVSDVTEKSIEGNASEGTSREKEDQETTGRKPGYIRVLLRAGSSSVYHKSVKIVPSKDCTVSVSGSSIKKTVKAGKAFTIKENSSFLKEGTVLVTPEKNGKIKVCSIKRACGNPSYRGVLELRKTGDGILLINELLLEEYLYSVVPSEMPVSYGMEALKVQAVCARCYAYAQLGSGAMEKFYADVDDSTAYQVYNNVAETKESIKAVDSTKGMVPCTKDGKMITAYYYSTSCGYTANFEEAWEREEDAGQGRESSYLTGKPQFIRKKEAEKELDLSTEKNFADFIRKETRPTFDSNFPWYRWSVAISKTALQNSVEENLEERQKANSSMIDVSYKNAQKKTLGKWKSMEIVSRSKTGMITCLSIKFSEAEIIVHGEYNIRCLLAPGNAKIKRQDGSVVAGLSLLPSSFFFVTEKKEEYVFSGGGYGHGVGMSQNGVKTMAEKGYHWEEIISHYYEGVELKTKNS